MYSVIMIVALLVGLTCMIPAHAKTRNMTHVKRFYCKHKRHKIVEIGYFREGFYGKRKQHFIKKYHINKGYKEVYCADGVRICRTKARPTLVSTKYISRYKLESHMTLLEDQCRHTFTIRNGKLKHAPPKRWGYTY